VLQTQLSEMRGQLRAANAASVELRKRVESLAAQLAAAKHARPVGMIWENAQVETPYAPVFMALDELVTFMCFALMPAMFLQGHTFSASGCGSVVRALQSPEGGPGSGHELALHKADAHASSDPGISSAADAGKGMRAALPAPASDGDSPLSRSLQDQAGPAPDARRGRSTAEQSGMGVGIVPKTRRWHGGRAAAPSSSRVDGRQPRCPGGAARQPRRSRSADAAKVLTMEAAMQLHAQSSTAEQAMCSLWICPQHVKEL
jgi:hypothetical protein